jgi:type III pantothenate kinase
MNLIIDIGNSRTKYSVFDDKTEVSSYSENILTTKTIETILKKHTYINKCILSATGHIPENIINFLNQNIKYCLQFSHRTPLPFHSEYKTIETLGLDRLAAVSGANVLHPGENVLIIDLGTAITYDLKNEANIHLGGNISPGMHLRFKALNEFTNKLPLVNPNNGPTLIGLSTVEAIENGVLHGIISEIDAFIDEIESLYNNLTIILTGGDAQFFVNKLKKTIFVVQNLVSTGLNSILSHNAENI